MATIKGRAIVWGVGNLTWTGAIASATSDGFLQKTDLSKSADSAEIKDATGETVTKVFFNPKNTLAVTVIPCALSGTNTVTNAEASVSLWMPAIGGAVTFTGDTSQVADNTQSGKFYITSAKLSRTVDNAASVDLELEQYVTNDLSVTVS